MMPRGLICAALLLAANVARADPLIVFAAASLKEPMDAIAADFGDTVVSYGGSGTLARQILQGAPADVVVLAHPQWMDALGDLAQDRVDLLGNELVLIGPVGPPLGLEPDILSAALGDGRLAVGLTGAVPAGQYAKEALNSLGLWTSLKDQLAEVDSVRAALVLVARQEAPLGITYATDAAADARVTVRATFPAGSHSAIIYPAARISDDPRAASFLSELTGPMGQSTFASFGFQPLTAQ
ncbi:molybdate ABC transporter substrate-binding protein [Yoonia sp. R2331]|uniref:molybdate ABC transporter substrate-binding protein n=1 Tax=Yoonia sp. R2331 TaxID=3237238 RepID=UPI0034E55670